MRRGRALVVALGLAAAWPATVHAQGLQPPPPMGQPVQPWGAPASAWGGTQATAPPAVLAAEQADSGRGFELVWVNAELGGGLVNLGDDIVLPNKGGGTGLLGAAVGVRFVVWTLGARLRLLPSSGFTLYQINGELGFHLPLGAWDPYLSLHGGYLTSGLHGDAGAAGTPAPHGFDLGLSVGDDYYFTPLFSAGLDATLDVLFVKRDAASAPAAYVGSAPYDADRSSIGLALLASAHVGLHFDL